MIADAGPRRVAVLWVAVHRSPHTHKRGGAVWPSCPPFLCGAPCAVHCEWRDACLATDADVTGIQALNEDAWRLAASARCRVDRFPLGIPDDAEQMGANGRGSKVGRIDPTHGDTGPVRRLDLTSVSFVSPLIIAQSTQRGVTIIAWAQSNFIGLSTDGQPGQAARETAPTQASHSSRSSVQQFKTETDAKSHCGTDQVVWGNMGSHVLHDAGTKLWEDRTRCLHVQRHCSYNAGYHEAKE